MPRACAEAGPPSKARHVLVLVKGDNATYGYFLDSRLRDAALSRFAVHSIEDGVPDGVDPDGLYVIVCRYIDRRNLTWIERNRPRLAGVAYFIDDDIPPLVAGPDGTLLYRIYVAWFAGLWIPRLNRLLSIVWVSTPRLHAVHVAESARVELVPPRPVLADHLPSERRTNALSVRIAYHASDVHGREHRFLVPIVRKVLAGNRNVSFEVMARGRNRRLWQAAGIDPAQLSIVPVLSWADYLVHSRENPADILLVPLMDTRLNSARADTKRIDACRMGAAALFSSGDVYGRNGHAEEILLDNEPGEWIEALNMLVADEQRRDKAANGTRMMVEAMAARPGKLAFGVAGD